MPRRSKREIERALQEHLPQERPIELGGEDAQAALEQYYADARDSLPDSKIEKLDALVAEIDDVGFYAENTDATPAGDHELTTPAKEWLNLVIGEAAHHRLKERRFE